MYCCRWDATRLPLRPGVVDSIVTDLPWGKGSHTYVISLGHNVIARDVV